MTNALERTDAIKGNKFLKGLQMFQRWTNTISSNKCHRSRQMLYRNKCFQVTNTLKGIRNLIKTNATRGRKPWW